VRCSFATLASSSSLRVRDARRREDPNSSPKNRSVFGRRTNETLRTASKDSKATKRVEGWVSVRRPDSLETAAQASAARPSHPIRQAQQNGQHHSIPSTPTMLSSRLLRPPARQLLSRNAPPPALPNRRAFHATRRRNDALDTVLYLPHEMLSQMHAYLPWYAAIPLTAFLVRGVLVTTAGSWSRSLTARYIGLQPLRQALAYQTRHALLSKGGYSNPREAQQLIAVAIRKETRALDERWKCTLRGQISWTLLQIPIFLSMAEVVRKMCGTRDGLLSMGASAIGWRTEDYSIHGVSFALENPWFQPSLANEGMLWFPDLLVPDPTGALPFVVSTLMFSNVFLAKNGHVDPSNAPGFSRRLRRVLLGVSLLIGPLCQGVPAALMLYWAGSTSSVIVWNWWLDWRYPSPKDALACRRPLAIIPAPKTRRA
jgi:inner membrane protein COX18